MAIERVRKGKRPPVAIVTFGFNRTSIYKLINTALKSGVGIKTLHLRLATRQPRSLTSVQEKQVFRWANGHDQPQYGLDFGLWTRATVAEKKFGRRLGPTVAGKMLVKLGLALRKPL